jgi:uncharacterized protein (DUF1800 family)
MGRHSGSAYDAAPDEWRPEDDERDKGHSPVTRRQVLGILGVAGAAAACTSTVSVLANKPAAVSGDGAMPAGAPAKPVGLAAGAAGVTAPTSDKMAAKAYDKTGYRASKPPQLQAKPLMQPPTLLSLDMDAHWARRLTYGLTPGVLRDIKAMGRERYLESQLTMARTDPAVNAVGERYRLLTMSPTQLKQLFAGNDQRPDDQKLDYMAAEDQLVEMKIIKTAWSQNQLFERVHDVWASFVHVPVGEKTRLMAPDFDRNVVRKHTFGRFADMLKAAIFHPAMLTYLDQPESNGNAKGEDGRIKINENLGREILELFSVGSLDPITSKPNYSSRDDVVMSAYTLTGLTVDRDTLTYKFDPNMRYRGALKVMGWRHANTNPAQGKAVIESYINYLAYHPATARHIAEQFARHFIGDTPRPQLIASMANVFMQSRTDIKPMLRALFKSDDFRKSVGQKFRTPWEFVAAQLRASGATLDTSMEDSVDKRRGTINGVRDLRYLIEQNGGHVNNRATPDGQPDYQAAWLSGKGLLDRWNSSGILAANGWKGVKVPSATALVGKVPTQAALVSGLTNRVVGQQLQAGFVTAIHQMIGTAPTSPASRVQDQATLLRTVLSSPHMNYS